MFKVSIVGLGLMGGSLAFAMKGFRNCERIGVDINEDVMRDALRKGAIDRCVPIAEIGTALAESDLSVFCINHKSIIKSLVEYMPYFKSGSVVSDICGVKNKIYKQIKPCLREDIDYVGIHPMTGKEVGGFCNADENLYKGSNFLIIPVETTHPESLALMEELAKHLMVSRILVSEMATHDYVIGYTSDLMHVSAAALCDCYPEEMTLDFTAGAFRDCTRIANIDSELWTDLLISNGENVSIFLKTYIENLSAMKTAIDEADYETLNGLLARASKNKKEMLLK